MVYIKTEEGIYDANFAILAVEPYLKGKNCHVSFSPCSLLPKKHLNGKKNYLLSLVTKV